MPIFLSQQSAKIMSWKQPSNLEINLATESIWSSILVTAGCRGVIFAWSERVILKEVVCFKDKCRIGCFAGIENAQPKLWLISQRIIHDLFLLYKEIVLLGHIQPRWKRFRWIWPGISEHREVGPVLLGIVRRPGESCLSHFLSSPFSCFLFLFRIFLASSLSKYFLQDPINFWCLDASSPLIRRHERELT